MKDILDDLVADCARRGGDDDHVSSCFRVVAASRSVLSSGTRCIRPNVSRRPVRACLLLARETRPRVRVGSWFVSVQAAMSESPMVAAPSHEIRAPRAIDRVYRWNARSIRSGFATPPSGVPPAFRASRPTTTSPRSRGVASPRKRWRESVGSPGPAGRCRSGQPLNPQLTAKRPSESEHPHR